MSKRLNLKNKASKNLKIIFKVIDPQGEET
jgi:hypothetical protein